MATPPVLIRFMNVDIARAGQYAETLRSSLLNAAPGLSVERRKESQETQDFGATLGIALAAPSVVAIAKGIQVWLERNRGVKIEIVTSDKKVVIENSTTDIVVDVLRAALADTHRKQ